MFELQDIEARIPHRPPFLFIDRVLEMDDQHIVAERLVRPDEPHFAGHYPGNPIMPGVLICEAVFQAAAFFLAQRQSKDATTGEGTPLLARISDAKFRTMVKPGDLLRLTVTYREALSKFHFLDGLVEVDGRKTATVSFALTVA